MRAIIQENYGEAENVLLRVHAAGVDRGFWHLMAGLPYAVRLAEYGIWAPKIPCQAGRSLGGLRRSAGT